MYGWLDHASNRVVSAQTFRGGPVSERQRSFRMKTSGPIVMIPTVFVKGERPPATTTLSEWTEWTASANA